MWEYTDFKFHLIKFFLKKEINIFENDFGYRSFLRETKPIRKYSEHMTRTSANRGLQLWQLCSLLAAQQWTQPAQNSWRALENISSCSKESNGGK